MAPIRQTPHGIFVDACPSCGRPIREPFDDRPHLATRPHHRGPGMKPCRIAFLLTDERKVYVGELQPDTAMEELHGAPREKILSATTRYFRHEAA